MSPLGWIGVGLIIAGVSGILGYYAARLRDWWADRPPEDR
jgi:hypothetical protein